MTTVDVGLTTVLAREVMSAPALTIAPSATLWEAWRLMTASGLRHLVVAEAGHVVGVVDDRAVFAQWPMGPLALRRNRVDEVMAPRTRCVGPDVELRDVAAVMVADAVDAVPVIDDGGAVVGIVTSADITRAAAADGMWRLTV
jgi:acetoin utilization protein AcuB